MNRPVTAWHRIDDGFRRRLVNTGHLLSGSADQTVRLWNLETGETLEEFDVAGGESVCFSPDSNFSLCRKSFEQ